jgi:hypothetical protein
MGCQAESEPTETASEPQPPPVPAEETAPPIENIPETDTGWLEWIGEARSAMLNAASGLPPDRTFMDRGNGLRDISQTRQETISSLSALGTDLELIASVLEVGMVTPEISFRGVYVMMNDGSHGWGGLKTYDDRDLDGVEMEQLTSAAPPIAALINSLADGLALDNCTLNLVTPDQMSQIPEYAQRGIIVPQEALTAVCEAFNLLPETWVPKPGTVTLILKAGEQYGLLRSSVQLAGEGVVLGPVVFWEP